MRVDPNYITNLTSSLDQSTAEEDTLTSELSSGLRVSSLSVDPVAAAQSMLLASSIAKDDTFVQTASNESSRMQVADSTLGEVVSQVTSWLFLLAARAIMERSMQATSPALPRNLAGYGIRWLSLANASYQGQYLFGGSQGSGHSFFA